MLQNWRFYLRVYFVAAYDDVTDSAGMVWIKPVFPVTKPIRPCFIGGIALLQVALLPSTLLMHIGCDHSHHLPAVSEAKSSCHSRAHCRHHAHGDPHHNESPQPVHDPDNCPVCQLAFAGQLTGFYIAVVPACGVTVVALVAPQQLLRGDTCYALPVRGPPIV